MNDIRRWRAMESVNSKKINNTLVSTSARQSFRNWSKIPCSFNSFTNLSSKPGSFMSNLAAWSSIFLHGEGSPLDHRTDICHRNHQNIFFGPRNLRNNLYNKINRNVWRRFVATAWWRVRKVETSRG